MLFSLSIVINTSSKNPVNPPPLPLGQTQVECVTNLTINKFTRHPSDNWKVVVSGPDEMTQKEIIKYEASTPNKDPFNTYNWLLGNETPGPKGFVNYWNVSPLPGPFKLKGEAYIPYTKLPMLNDDFGSTHGDVTVIENNQTPGANQKDVKVFFRKDDVNYKDDKVPNWFFYWSQIPEIKSLLNIGGLHLYTEDVCDFNSTPTPFMLNLRYNKNLGKFGNVIAGRCYFQIDRTKTAIPKKCLESGESSYFIVSGYNPEALIIELGPVCGFSQSSIDCPEEGKANPIIQGIHSFISTIVHETEHARIKCEVWNYTTPNDPNVKEGYNEKWDKDKDGYKDIWELSDIGVNNKFKIEDPSTNADKYNSNYQNCFCAKTCSAGTMYEETRCREKAHIYNLKFVDNQDWSFDPEDDNQGKQWK